MGTRGLYCFLYKGKYYIIYNHWDSYPEGLGETLLEQLQGFSLQELRERLVHNIIICDGKYPEITQEIVDNFRTFIMQDESYFESWLRRSSMYIKNNETGNLEAIIRRSSGTFYTWICKTYDSLEEKWSFLLGRIFCVEGLCLKKVLSLGYLLLEEFPTERAPENDLWIEWIYIIDLDEEKFLVQSNEGDEWEFKLEEILMDVGNSEKSLAKKLI
ncbi:23323_t:CDS:1 [Entrophospora sp. SA101]|nr:10941_t:CDS:1 [Entrophospora candida]CAH1764233.1 8030_t:CDS:1 [Entrophospora sp. SA101]CAG8471247.1 244_t:CDS:1 [Entrophospora candida]CAJ0626109.1 6909_t:CDS:1 [Entrophospora sp. SA101]CAJ0764703.1 23323_t:CDS:1 [Entrophospora sp. SA101]